MKEINREKWLSLGIELLNNHKFSIVPLEVGTKHPFIAWKPYAEKYPTEGELQAWVKDSRFGGWMVVTGKLSNLVVVDVDKEAETFDESTLPSTVTVKTPDSGKHYYYRWHELAAMTGVDVLAPHVDIRNGGGVAPVPPSLYEDKVRQYEWLKDLSHEIAAFPEQYYRQPESKQTVTELPENNLIVLASKKIEEGGRHQHLTMIVGKLLSYCSSNRWSLVDEFVHKVNEKYLTPPTPKGEVNRILSDLKKSELDKRSSGLSAFSTDEEEFRIADLIYAECVLFSATSICVGKANDHNYYAVFSRQPHIMHKIDSEFFKSKLNAYIQQRAGIPLSEKVLQGLIHRMKVTAEHRGRLFSIRVRYHRTNREVFIDLGDDEKIKYVAPLSFMMRKKPNLVFYRPNSFVKFPKLSKEKKPLDELLSQLSLDPEQQLFVKMYLITLVINIGDNPILYISSPNSEWVTNLLGVIRRLIDPASPEFYTVLPKREELVVSMTHQELFCINGVSELSSDEEKKLYEITKGIKTTKIRRNTDDELIAQEGKSSVVVGWVANTVPRMLYGGLHLHHGEPLTASLLSKFDCKQLLNEVVPVLLPTLFDHAEMALFHKGKVRLEQTITGNYLFDTYFFAAGLALNLEPKKIRMILQRCYVQPNSDDDIEAKELSLLFRQLMKRSNKQQIKVHIAELLERLRVLNTETGVFRGSLPAAPNKVKKQFEPMLSRLLRFGIKLKHGTDSAGAFYVITIENTKTTNGSPYVYSSNGDSGDSGDGISTK